MGLPYSFLTQNCAVELEKLGLTVYPVVTQVCCMLESSKDLVTILGSVYLMLSLP